MGRRQVLSESERRAQFAACVVDLPHCSPPSAPNESGGKKQTSIRDSLYCGRGKKLSSERVPAELARRVRERLEERLERELEFEDVAPSSINEAVLQQPPLVRCQQIQHVQPRNNSQKKRKSSTESKKIKKKKKKSKQSSDKQKLNL